MIALFELPNDETILPEDHWLDVGEEITYQPAYCQLASTRQDIPDILKGILTVLIYCNVCYLILLYFADVTEPRQYLAQSLSVLSSRQPGLVMHLVEQLSPDHRTTLNTYLQKFNVQIA